MKKPIFVMNYLVHINNVMKITREVITDFLVKQEKHITHYVVAHSYYHPYKKEDKDIERMKFNLSKDLRYARNCFNKELYGNGAKRKPMLYQPLLIPTLEGTLDRARKELTLHYNIYLGNLPKQLTVEDVKTLWTYCWHDKAKQSNDIFITKPIKNTNIHLLDYGTKEAQYGNIECWDFENTQIPYTALNAD